MTQSHSTADAGNGDNADSERRTDDAPEPVDLTESAAEFEHERPAEAAARRSHRQRRLGALANRLCPRWPIRAKLLLGALIPVLAITLLGGVAVANFVANSSSAADAHRLAGLDARATQLTQALQAERAAAATILAGNLTTDDAQFTDRAAATDAAARRFSGAIDDADVDSGHRIATAAAEAQRSVRSLTALRDDVAQRRIDSGAAMQRYGGIIGSVVAVVDAAPDEVRQTELADQLRSTALFTHYVEAGEQEAYLLYTAIVSGGFTPDSYRKFLASLHEQETYLAQFGQLADADDRKLVEERLSRAQLSGALAGENAAVRAGEAGDIGLDAQEWQGVAATKTELANEVGRRLNADASDASSSERTKQLLYAGGVALLALSLIVLSVVAALRIARSMTRGLGELRSLALEVVQRRLPEVVEQLRDIDAARSSDSKVAKVRATATEAINQRLSRHPTDEIGDATYAFNLVYREAIDIAVQQAQRRLSVAATFVNLARRSQLLVDRLIRLIDKLEHSERDPDRLSELFQLDHLVTRMRRNDENLLVLAGAEAGRRWTRSAPLLDVLRAATAEIEQYTRVKIGDVVPVAVAAHAVSDIVHLVAELTENATTFSPPRTDVAVQTRIFRGSILIEIRDQGIGMAVDQLDELNERLASPHAANVQSRMMGLHVVAKLAARHGVAVSLAAAAPQGTIAAIMLPATLLQVSADASDSEAAIDPAAWAPETDPVPATGTIPPQRGGGQHESLPTTPAPGGDDDQSTEFVRPMPSTGEPRGHKHWRFGEPTEKDSVADVTLAIFESMESEWFREVPAESEPAPTLEPTNAEPDTGGAAADESDQQTEIALPSKRTRATAAKRKTKRANRAESGKAAESEDFTASDAEKPARSRPRAEQTSVPIRARFPMPAAQTWAAGTASVRPEWRSAADAGWQRAAAVTPHTGGTTEAGLPKRIPMTNYIPGGVSTSAQVAAVVAPLRRSPEAIGAGLSSYRSGVEHGRRAGRADNSAPSTDESKE